MDTQKNRSGNDEVFIESISETITLLVSTFNAIQGQTVLVDGNGDEIVITVWGIQIFSVTGISPDQNRRRVDSNGNIYFPFVG